VVRVGNCRRKIVIEHRTSFDEGNAMLSLIPLSLVRIPLELHLGMLIRKLADEATHTVGLRPRSYCDISMSQ
jgi:hypothetical protein